MPKGQHSNALRRRHQERRIHKCRGSHALVQQQVPLHRAATGNQLHKTDRGPTHFTAALTGGAQAEAEEPDLQTVVTALEALMEPRRRLAKTLAGGGGDCGGRLRRGLAQPSLPVVMLARSRMPSTSCLKLIRPTVGLHTQAKYRTLSVGLYKFLMSRALLRASCDIYRDVIFLDIALEAASRGVIEASLGAVKTAASAGAGFDLSASYLHLPTCVQRRVTKLTNKAGATCGLCTAMPIFCKREPNESRLILRPDAGKQALRASAARWRSPWRVWRAPRGR